MVSLASLAIPAILAMGLGGVRSGLCAGTWVLAHRGSN